MNRESLEQIAEADWGREKEKHLWALRSICESGFVPIRYGWWPGGVMSLAQWDKAVVPISRALCCSILLMASLENNLFLADSTGAVLVDCCIRIGPEASAMGERLLVWLLEVAGLEWEQSPTVLFLLLLLRSSHDPDDVRLGKLLLELSQLPGAGDLGNELAHSQCKELLDPLVETHLNAICTRVPRAEEVLKSLGFLGGLEDIDV